MPFDANQTTLNQLGYLLAEASRTVVFVLGAGVSKPAGVPLWPDLLQDLSREAVSFIDKDTAINSNTRDKKRNQINEVTDPWLLGDLLAENIPQEAYDRLIRNRLGCKCPPQNYELLWSLNPSGIVSFNLDDLAQISLDGCDDQVATGFDTGKYEKFLLLSRPFLFQPHGSLAKKKSWVLGTRARNKLLKDTSYRNFVRSLLSTRRLVIVGFKPDDIAFQTLLIDDFRTDITRGVNHFWICPNPDHQTRMWASDFNILLIEYTPSDQTHPEVTDILSRLSTYRPRSLAAEAVYDGAVIRVDELPPDDQLRTHPIEDIRRRLNAALKGIESETDEHNYLTKAEAFFKSYSGSLHMAWHVEPSSSYEAIWGAKVTENLGGGAFGGVWRAEEPVDGQIVAVKILHESVLRNRDFLEAFRRGVRAMRILSEAKVKGMVNFIRAFDVPACVFMEYIDGITFEQAIDSDQIEAESRMKCNTALQVVD